MDLDAEVYGQAWAEDYDILTPITPAMTAAAIGRLARLADGGPVLELAAGTGRLSIGLADLGLAVTATDISPAMLDQLRAKDPTEPANRCRSGPTSAGWSPRPNST
jgi:ubiquinone/menaquinone biosynthesis C-methylase UbiE